MWDDMNYEAGTFVYDAYPDFAEWDSWFDDTCAMGSMPTHPNRYYDHLPVWSEDNVYFGGAKPWKKEKDPFVDDSFEVKLTLKEEKGAWILDTNIFDHLPGKNAGIISTATLGMAFEPEQRFENPDGTEITFDETWFGKKRNENNMPGPFADSMEAAGRLF